MKLNKEQIEEIIKAKEENNGRLKYGQVKEFSERFKCSKQTIYDKTSENQINFLNKKFSEKSESTKSKQDEDIINLIKEKADEEMIVVVSKKIMNTLREKNFVYAGRSNMISYAGAIYYLACRKLNLPENLRNIQEKFNVEKVKFIHGRIKIIKKALGMNYCDKASVMGTSCLMVHTPEKYIEKLCEVFKLSDELKSECFKELNELKESIYTSPEGIACGIVFTISKENNLGLTQREIADTLGVTEVTLRNNLYKIKEIREMIK